MHSASSSAAARLVCALLLTTGLSTAAIIDDFSANQSVSSGAGTNFGSVQDPSILGGERDVQVFAGLGIGGFTASGGFATVTNDVTSIGGIQISYDGIDGLPTTLGLGGIDLTDGGLSDRILLDLFAGSSGTAFRLFVQDTSNNSLDAFMTLSGGFLQVQFSAAPTVDFTDVNFLRVSMPGIGPNSTVSTVSFDDLCSGNADGCVDAPIGEEVPEPSTWLLMASGLALAAWRRRRSA